ncbi:MAG: ABC transporter substrate-binding protein, partial [Hydrogenophaga sp.]|nr:ABC transporter substrate-binding protein [Hydrogenophaga sp.]
MKNRRHILTALGAACLAAGAFAQTAPFPNKTLSLVVPYAPGGPTDAMARTLATALKPVLGQTVIVENKA